MQHSEVQAGHEYNVCRLVEEFGEEKETEVTEAYQHAYLQAASLQADHLCRQARAHRLLRTRKTKKKLVAPVVVEPSSHQIREGGPNQATLTPALQAALEATFGFKLTVRTLTYIVKRLDEFGYAEQPQLLFQRILTKNRLQDFRTIFREVLNREAFEETKKNNVDAINAVNFALFDEIQGKKVAQEGLRSVLRWRKERSRW